MQKRIAYNTVETPGFMTRVREFIDRLLGCWHKDVSRPFTVDGSTYRVCLDCGAKRPFIAEKWANTGTFYREPISEPACVEQPCIQQPIVVSADVRAELGDAPLRVAA